MVSPACRQQQASAAVWTGGGGCRSTSTVRCLIFNITPPTHRLSVTAALSQWQFTFSSTPSNWTLTSATVDLMEFNPFLQDHLTCRRLHLPAASSLRQTNKGQRRVKFKDYSRWLQNSLGMGMVGTDQKNRRCMKDERASFSLHSYIKHTGSSWSVLQ